MTCGEAAAAVTELSCPAQPCVSWPATEGGSRAGVGCRSWLDRSCPRLGLGWGCVLPSRGLTLMIDGTMFFAASADSAQMGKFAVRHRAEVTLEAFA